MEEEIKEAQEIKDEAKTSQPATEEQKPVEAKAEKPDKAVNYDELLKTDKGLQAFIKSQLESARGNWQNEQTEAEKLKSMSDEERAKYEMDTAAQENEALKAELNAIKLEKQATEIAENEGVPASLIALYDFSKVDAAQLDTGIKEMAKAFKSAVETGINERLRQATPQNRVTQKDPNQWNKAQAAKKPWEKHTKR